MNKRPAVSSDIIDICNDLLDSYSSSFPKEDIIDIFKNSGIYIKIETGRIRGSDLSARELWNVFFEIIVSHRGLAFLAMMESGIKSIHDTYGLPLPPVLTSSLYEMAHKYTALEKERNSLLETLYSVENEYQIPDRIVFKDPLAQVYREDMFLENLISDITIFRKIGINFAFFIIEIDRLIELNNRYGREAGDELLANTAYLLKNFKKTNREYAHHLIFRMNGPRFTYYCNDITHEEIVMIADNVRTAFRESKLFVTDITVSAGLVHADEFAGIDSDPESFAAEILNTANSRLRLAKHSGFDLVCSVSGAGVCFAGGNYILVVDPDLGARTMLESHLGRSGFRVKSCTAGDEALRIVDTQKPDIVISGAMLPKIDGFTLRKKMLEDSALKDIPFVLTSIVKDEKSIIRAQSLGIYHFFKTPYSIIEMVGLVKNLSNSGI
jgi:two-component system, cell cycle response regulator